MLLAGDPKVMRGGMSCLSTSTLSASRKLLPSVDVITFNQRSLAL